jgi:DNA processing protein
MADTAAIEATLRLHLADGVGALTFRKLIEAFGSPAAALDAGQAGWRSVQGIGEKTAAAIKAVTDEQVRDELELADRAGVRILTAGDAEFPEALRNIHDCPVVLYVRGRLDRNDAVALGIVGSRRCTYYGLEQAERFGGLLARAGFTVVSGGARGIDTAAHRGALAAGGRTLAVMGCGLSKTYPPENADLFEQIIAEDRGALVSELPMAVGVQSRNFPLRNRIISGLTLGTLVVEAARKSGAMITAREAIEQGREVFAIPGRIDSVMSQGTNYIIGSGSAKLVQDLDDILDGLGEVGRTLIEPAPTDDERLTAAVLNPRERSLVTALKEREKSLDELVRETRLDASAVISTLTMLAIRGIVAQRPGAVFALKRNG